MAWRACSSRVARATTRKRDIHVLFSRLKNALHTRPLDDSLEDEIQDHLERRAAAFREEGLSPAEARRRALTAFGSVTRIREQSREIRLWAGLDGTIQDVRYAWRTMHRSPVLPAYRAATIDPIVALRQE